MFIVAKRAQEFVWSANVDTIVIIIAPVYPDRCDLFINHLSSACVVVRLVFALGCSPREEPAGVKPLATGPTRPAREVGDTLSKKRGEEKTQNAE